MNTLQQLASAVGTALIVSVMTSGQKEYLRTHTGTAAQELAANSLSAGVHNAFILAAAITLIGVIAGFFVRRSVIPGSDHGPNSGAGTKKKAV
ncbi:hypothetical protein D3C75_840810 [compost metagenome]